MNNSFPPSMTTLDGFGFNANTMAHDVSEDENEDNFADVSNILHHLNKDDFNEDSFPMISNDLSLSSLDFSMEDNSLEPTPIRPDGILSVTTHNAACIPSHGSTTITTTLNSEYPSTSLLSLSTKRDFSSLMLGVSSSCNPNVAPERNAFAIPSCNDRESCYIRPTKIAQMVSSNSFARSALDGRNHFGIRPEYQVSSTPPRSSGISKVAASHLGVSVHSTGDRWTSNNKSKSHPANQSSSQSPSKDANSNSDDEAARFRTYQSDQWKERFEELKAYKETFGHCVVPHNYLHNGSPALAQWVKRQRFQWKQRIHNKRSTVTDERMHLLSSLGFVFDSHQDAWSLKYASLQAFKEQHGHAGVPSKWHDKELAIWVKCQRRNYKLHCQGRKSAMTPERVALLEALDFNWNPRNL